MTTKTTAKAAATGKDTVDQMVNASAEGYEQAIEMTREQVQKTSTAMLKNYDEIATLNKEGFDAFVRAGNVFAKGFEDLGKIYAGIAQASAEKSVEAAKAMMKARTLQDLIDLQNNYAKTAFDSMMADGTRLSEMSLKVANEAMEPIQVQFNAAVEKFSRTAA